VTPDERALWEPVRATWRGEHVAALALQDRLEEMGMADLAGELGAVLTQVDEDAS
jgi:hypothetical protein